MSIPQIGEVVSHFYDNTWHDDWMTMKRFDFMIDKVHYVEAGVLVWGNTKERFKNNDVWREKNNGNV